MALNSGLRCAPSMTLTTTTSYGRPASANVATTGSVLAAETSEPYIAEKLRHTTGRCSTWQTSAARAP
eukprot:2125796-Rhodomonas_salina.3